MRVNPIHKSLVLRLFGKQTPNETYSTKKDFILIRLRTTSLRSTKNENE